MDVTVAVLAHNESGSIGQLLRLVDAAPLGHHRLVQVVVYDDGSTDDTAAIVEREMQRMPLLSLLRGTQRRGTMVGMQAIAAAARGDVVVRLDADVTPSTRAIERLADVIERGAAIAIGANTPVFDCATVASLSAAFATSVVERLKAGPHAQYYAVGRLIAYRTSALRSIEFPEHIINEDHYAAGMIVRHGGSVKFEPAATCTFRVPLSFRDYCNQSRRVLEGERQLERHGIKRAPLSAVVAAVGVRALAAPVQAIVWAFAYAVSSIQRAPAVKQPWPISKTTKGPPSQTTAA